MNPHHDLCNKARGNATHNELHDANRMAEFQATGTFDRQHSGGHGSYPAASNSRGARGWNARRAANAASTQSGQSSGNNAQTLWTLVGAGAGFVGVMFTDVMHQMEDDKVWIPVAIATAVGAFLGYKLHKLLSILLAITVAGGTIYFISNIDNFN